MPNTPNEAQEQAYQDMKAMYDGKAPLDKEFCQRALQEFPNDHRLRVLLGHLKSNQGLYDESLAYLKEARNIVMRKHFITPTPESEQELTRCEEDIAVAQRCRGGTPLGKPQISSIPSL